MCITLATAAAISAIAGAGLTAYGTYQSGQSAKATGSYNQALADAKTADAIQTGSAAEESQRRQVAGTLGSQRAGMGASGLQMDTGSFANILTDTSKYGELDAQTVRTNALKQAWGYQTEGLSQKYSGDLAARSGGLNAMGTILGGGAQAYGLWKQR